MIVHPNVINQQCGIFKTVLINQQKSQGSYLKEDGPHTSFLFPFKERNASPHPHVLCLSFVIGYADSFGFTTLHDIKLKTALKRKRGTALSPNGVQLGLIHTCDITT